MSTLATGAQVIAKVREIAASNPTFKYVPPGDGDICVYFYDGQPSCIIGQAIHALGLPHPEEGEGAIKALDVEWVDITRPDLDWLDTAQSMQDDGYTWEEAVEAADACYGNDDERNAD